MLLGDLVGLTSCNTICSRALAFAYAGPSAGRASPLGPSAFTIELKGYLFWQTFCGSLKHGCLFLPLLQSGGGLHDHPLHVRGVTPALASGVRWHSHLLRFF